MAAPRNVVNSPSVSAPGACCHLHNGAALALVCGEEGSVLRVWRVGFNGESVHATFVLRWHVRHIEADPEREMFIVCIASHATELACVPIPDFSSSGLFIAPHIRISPLPPSARVQLPAIPFPVIVDSGTPSVPTRDPSVPADGKRKKVRKRVRKRKPGPIVEDKSSVPSTRKRGREVTAVPVEEPTSKRARASSTKPQPFTADTGNVRKFCDKESTMDDVGSPIYDLDDGAWVAFAGRAVASCTLVSPNRANAQVAPEMHAAVSVFTIVVVFITGEAFVVRKREHSGPETPPIAMHQWSVAEGRVAAVHPWFDGTILVARHPVGESATVQRGTATDVLTWSIATPDGETLDSVNARGLNWHGISATSHPLACGRTAIAVSMPMGTGLIFVTDALFNESVAFAMNSRVTAVSMDPGGWYVAGVDVGGTVAIWHIRAPMTPMWQSRMGVETKVLFLDMSLSLLIAITNDGEARVFDLLSLVQARVPFRYIGASQRRVGGSQRRVGKVDFATDIEQSFGGRAVPQVVNAMLVERK